MVEMKTESTRTVRHIYGIRVLGGATMALVFALGCTACFREEIESACIGMVFPAALSGAPYWVLERMIRNGGNARKRSASSWAGWRP